jgi:hypothetical protein
MPKKRVLQLFEVVPDPNGGWEVRNEGAWRVSRHYPDKAAAVETARRLAESHGVGQVRIHGRDGRVQNDWTYGIDPLSPQDDDAVAVATAPADPVTALRGSSQGKRLGERLLADRARDRERGR